MSLAAENGPRSGEPRISRILDRIRSDEEVSANSGTKRETIDEETPVVSDEFESSERWPLPGLAPMTRVRTSFGDVHAVALRQGDLVKIRSGEFKPIVWLNRVLLDEQFLAEKTDSNPIRITKGAMGRSTPKCDVMLSPRQIVCPGLRMNFQERREAADLLSKPGVMRIRETGLSYTMFHLGEPEEIQCDGMILLLAPPTDSV